MRKSCLAALSLMGMSCASLGPLVGGRDRSGGGDKPVRRAASEAAAKDAQLISETTLGALSIRKWRLGNGLEVVLMPDPAATSVAYMTWFRVGSRHENADAGETGLAHLFEHLMFTQTRAAKAPGEFDRRMEQAGASTNAMTYYDFTAYIDELPPGEVPLAVDLESDRMVNLALTDDQVRTERDVVAEERLGDVDDSVDGTLDEMIYGKAFTRHPYRWPVIGRMADIKAVTRDKATRFYKTFYAPNNAVVVVAGRFDAQEVLSLVARGYGDIPPSTQPAHRRQHARTRPRPGDPAGHRTPGPGRPAGAGLPQPGPGRSRPGGLRGAGRDPHRRPVGPAAPAPGGREPDRLLGGRRRRRHPGSRPVRDLGAAAQGAPGRRGREDDRSRVAGGD